MPAYYKIKVVEIDKDEAMVKMHLKVINPDTMKIYNTIGFGLQLLYNFKWEGFPIATEIDSEDLSNPEWCTKYANGFVKSVEISERTKPRIPFAINDYEDPFWQSPELWPEAVLKVYCTDPAWLAHITVNEEWESYAYDVSRSYDDHEPILLNKNASEKAISSPDSFGWMPIPSFLFSQGSYRLPSVVLFPKFTESSYVVENIRDFSKEDHETVLSLHGRYVKHIRDDKSGIFVWNDLLKEYRICSFGHDTSGVRSYHSIEDIGKIGFLTLKSNFDRHIAWLDYPEILKKARPVIKSVQRSDKKVTLELTGIYNLTELELNKAKVLKLICNNFAQTYGYEVELDSDLPISRVFKYFISIKEKIFDPGQVILEIADGIILNYTIEQPDEYFEDYDAMDRERLIQYFENDEWPCLKIHIELSDESFGLQLDHVTQSAMLIQLKYMLDEIKPIGQSILWSDFSGLA